MAQTVLKNKDLKLVGFNDKDLNDKLPTTGKPVYQFRTIDTEKGFLNDQEITTACVEAVIVARTDTDEDILESVSDALLNYKQTLVKQTEYIEQHVICNTGLSIINGFQSIM